MILIVGTYCELKLYSAWTTTHCAKPNQKLVARLGIHLSSIVFALVNFLYIFTDSVNLFNSPVIFLQNCDWCSGTKLSLWSRGMWISCFQIPSTVKGVSLLVYKMMLYVALSPVTIVIYDTFQMFGLYDVLRMALNNIAINVLAFFLRFRSTSVAMRSKLRPFVIF